MPKYPNVPKSMQINAKYTKVWIIMYKENKVNKKA